MATASVSVRLDPDVRAALERDAREHGVGLSTYLRDLASERAKAVRKAEVRAESRRVAQYTAEHPHADDFYSFWGTPSGWETLG